MIDGRSHKHKEDRYNRVAMVTKLYIHNYKAFVDFHIEFGRIVFLMGRNGSGKSSIVDVLHALAMVIHDGNIEDFFDAETRFRFGDDADAAQKFRLDVELDSMRYQYHLEVGYAGRELRPFVIREELRIEDTPFHIFEGGTVTVDTGLKLGAADFDVHRGALASFGGDRDQGGRALFKKWAEGFLMLRLIPGAVKSEARKAADALDVDGANFVAWYETVANDDTLAGETYRRSMQEVIPGLRTINLKALYKSGKLWEARLEVEGKERGFALDELSEGQISLAVLYAILHFSMGNGATVALDEPDNYLALAEIEPFLYALEDAAELNRAQVFLISHHPEIYNHWARDPDRARYFEQSGGGHFTARTIDWGQYPGLSPAEVVARGWQDA